MEESSSNHETMQDGDEANKRTDIEAQWVSRRALLYADGPNVSTEYWSNKPGERGHSLRQTIRHADYVRGRHVIQKDRDRSIRKGSPAVTDSRADGQQSHDQKISILRRTRKHAVESDREIRGDEQSRTDTEHR